MNILSPLIFAFSANSDAFVIGMSYGVKKIRINALSNVAVSFIAGAGTYTAMEFGHIINTYIPLQMGRFIGSFMLILFGTYMLIDAARKKKKGGNPSKGAALESEASYYCRVMSSPEIIDADKSKIIEFKESIVLGGILCLNNVGMGIGAGIAGLNVVATSLLSFFFSVIFLHMGCSLGCKVIPDKLTGRVEVISAFIIIILGLYELFI